MEKAEMSINAHGNAVGGFDGMDIHKKALIGENSEMESGYVSNWSISQSHVTASTSGLSNSGKFSSLSFKKSLDLETISENNELKDQQETPTTQSIRNLNAFHINTPQNTRSELETTPKKGNHFANFYGSRSGSKRNRSQNIRWSLDKSQFDSILENSENTFNDEVAAACNQSINVSPIKPHNISNITIQQADKSHGIQRHPSGIESSTPKMAMKRTRTQSIVKPKLNLVDEQTRNRLMRKAQSFSPAKRSALRETNYRTVEPDTVYLEDDEVQAHNPARKFLEFTAEQFNQLTQQNRPALFQTPTKIQKHIVNDEIAPPATHLPSPTNKLKLKRLSAQRCESRLVKEFSRKKTIKPTIQTPKKSLGSLNESDILASLAPEQETEPEKFASSANNEDSLMDISDLVVTPSTNQAIFSDTPIRDDGVKQNVREDANRTPTKRFEKSISHSFLSVKTSPEKEKFDILYGDLPCTPPKNRQRRPMKRPAHIDSPLPNEPSAKRKLYEETVLEEPPCTVGIEKPPCMVIFEEMDILTQLKNRKMETEINKILRDLPDDSLQAVSSVCKSWKSLIDENRALRIRRRRFVKNKQMTKENVRRNDSKPNINENNNIKPLHIHNKNYQFEEKTVVVSPSTRRFNEHQQIIRNLKPDQRVLQCPRCNGISIVHPATEFYEPKIQRRSPRRQPNPMLLRSTTSSATKNKRNINITKIIVSEYASCSMKACGFEFCTNCNGMRHANAKCTKRPLGSSPRSDDDSPCKLEPPRSTKRDLRRLIL